MSNILPPSRWRSLADPSFGMLGVLSESIGRAAVKDPQSLPDLRHASALFIGTDYAGESPLVQFDAVTFVIADIRNLGQWVEARQRLRARYLPDGRRMAYSRLSDVQRAEALLPFLRAADSIPGLLASFLIDKRLGRNQVFPTSTVGLAFPDALAEKPRSVLRWLADGEYGRSLKRLVYTMEPGHRAGKVIFSDMRFSGPGLTG